MEQDAVSLSVNVTGCVNKLKALKHDVIPDMLIKAVQNVLHPRQDAIRYPNSPVVIHCASWSTKQHVSPRKDVFIWTHIVPEVLSVGCTNNSAY